MPSIALTFGTAGISGTEGGTFAAAGPLAGVGKGACLVSILRCCVRDLGVARTIGGWCVTAIALVVPAVPALARDKIAFPFTCGIDGGRLRLEPAADQVYPITGPRDQQPFTFCPAGEGGRCRTWVVHRFAIQCGGGRAMWSEVVAAAATRLQNRATVENGQLILALGPPRGVFASRRPAPQSARRANYIALPRGYAPLALVGARLVLDAEPSSRPQREQQQPARGNERTVTAPVQSLVTGAAPRPLVQARVSEMPETTAPVERAGSRVGVAVPPETTAPAPPPVAPMQVAWTPTAEASAPAVATRLDGPAGERSASFAAFVLAATMLLLATAAVRRWRMPAVQPAPRAGLQSSDGDGSRAVALRAKAETHIGQISDALVRLGTVAPLRNALARDLQTSERRLAVVVAAISAAGAEADGMTRARRRLERIAQDLDRLQQITDSAVTSLSGLRASAALPRNRDEAYATLGVAPGVSEAILKKLVEALRISWHPDLAHTDDEREARTVRITEINVAWDLITGKRESE